MAKIVEAVRPTPAQRVAAELRAIDEAKREIEGLRSAQIERLGDEDPADADRLADKIAAAERRLGVRQARLEAFQRADDLSGVERRHQGRLAALATFEEAAAAKNAAVAEFCKGAEIAQKAYLAIVDASHRMTNAVPPGMSLPRGSDTLSGEAVINGRPFPANLESLAAAELYRHCEIDRIGKTGAMPGARALSHEVIFDPSKIEPWHVSTARVSEYLLRALRQQIDAQHRAELGPFERENAA